MLGKSHNFLQVVQPRVIIIGHVCMTVSSLLTYTSVQALRGLQTVKASITPWYKVHGKLIVCNQHT